jgi:hypothetical protein
VISRAHELRPLFLYSESDADVVCQAGVTWNRLNETLKEKGESLLAAFARLTDIFSGIPLFFPVCLMQHQIIPQSSDLLA